MSLGEFKITAYGIDCNGCTGVTANGTVPEVGRTIASDWSILPPNTEVLIDGNVYIVEDKGGGIKGNHIDLFVGTESQSNIWGVQYHEVFIKTEGAK